MSAHNDLTNTLRFTCPACHAELAVPVQMAGIEGPCPSCYHTIRAPLTTPVFLPQAAEPAPVPEAVMTAPAWHDSGQPILPPADWTRTAQAPRIAQEDEEWQVEAGPVFPPSRGSDIAPLPASGRENRVMQPGAPLVAKESNFKARLAIPAAEDPLDDSWKERHRDQQRSSRRSRRVEKVAHQFLESRGFRVARVALILLSGAMLAFLFHYMKNHQWRFPGLAPLPVAEGKVGSDQGRVRPVGGDANELMADDDTEFPPMSGIIPGPPRSGAQPIAGPPR